ncbi:unnamed protein product [Gordionus sp. m RMFG-2023]
MMQNNKLSREEAIIRPFDIYDLDLNSTIGRGTYEKVYLAELKETRQAYAIKVVKRYIIDGIENSNRKECLSTIHPFLLDFHSFFQTPIRYLVESLRLQLKSQEKLSEKLVRFYSAEAILKNNILYIYFLNYYKAILHGDIEVDNIFIDGEGHVRLADYGICKEGIRLELRTNSCCGTPLATPKILRRNDCSFSVDWWLLGITMLDMLIGATSFEGMKSSLKIQIIYRPNEKLVGQHIFPKCEVHKKAVEMVQTLWPLCGVHEKA